MAVVVDPGFSLWQWSSDKDATCCKLYSTLLNIGWVALALV